MEDSFTPCGLHRYTGVWRMRKMKHWRVNQPESEKFVLHSSEFRKRLNFPAMIWRPQTNLERFMVHGMWRCTKMLNALISVTLCFVPNHIRKLNYKEGKVVFTLTYLLQDFLFIYHRKFSKQTHWHFSLQCTCFYSAFHHNICHPIIHSAACLVLCSVVLLIPPLPVVVTLRAAAVPTMPSVQDSWSGSGLYSSMTGMATSHWTHSAVRTLQFAVFTLFTAWLWKFTKIFTCKD